MVRIIAVAGQCSACHAWNTITEMRIAASPQWRETSVYQAAPVTRRLEGAAVETSVWALRVSPPGLKSSIAYWRRRGAGQRDPDWRQPRRGIDPVAADFVQAGGRMKRCMSPGGGVRSR